MPGILHTGIDVPFVTLGLEVVSARAMPSASGSLPPAVIHERATAGNWNGAIRRYEPSEDTRIFARWCTQVARCLHC